MDSHFLHLSTVKVIEKEFDKEFLTFIKCQSYRKRIRHKYMHHPVSLNTANTHDRHSLKRCGFRSDANTAVTTRSSSPTTILTSVNAIG